MKVLLLLVMFAGSLAAQMYSMPAEPDDGEFDPISNGIEWQGATGIDQKLLITPVFDANGKHIANDVALSANGGAPVTTRYPITPTKPITVTRDVLLFIGTMGNDVIDLRGFFPPPVPGLPPLPKCFICGLSGNDVIVGTLRDDFIFAGAGNDVVFDFLGDEVIFGNADDDALWGGPGNDLIYGNAGNDNKPFPKDPATGRVVTALRGLVGAAGDDQIVGGPGDDDIFGEAGNDRLVCKDGVAGGNSVRAHYVAGGAGDDQIWGCNDDSRRDQIFGDDPADPTIGGADKISTGKGPDAVDGGPLEDQIFVGDVALTTLLNRQLTVIGNTGADYIQLAKAWGTVYGDRVNDVDIGDADTVEILDGHPSKGYKILCGGGADTVMNGGPGNDEVYGQGGNDVSLHGGDGQDGISGGDGSDDILGGDKEDRLAGDGDADVLNGEEQDDEIYDFSDGCSDTLRGGPGADKLYCNDNATLNPDFVFGEVDVDLFEFDDVESAPPQTDADVPGGESATVKPPRPNEIINVSRGLLGW